MDDAHALPNDLAECQRLLLAAFQRTAELSRVLQETAASYGELQATHQAALEELSARSGGSTVGGPRSWSRDKASDICLISNLRPQRLNRLSRLQNYRARQRRHVAVAGNSTSTSCRTIGTSMI